MSVLQNQAWLVGVQGKWACAHFVLSVCRMAVPHMKFPFRVLWFLILFFLFQV